MQTAKLLRRPRTSGGANGVDGFADVSCCPCSATHGRGKVHLHGHAMFRCQSISKTTNLLENIILALVLTLDRLLALHTRVLASNCHATARAATSIGSAGVTPSRALIVFVQQVDQPGVLGENRVPKSGNSETPASGGPGNIVAKHLKHLQQGLQIKIGAHLQVGVEASIGEHLDDHVALEPGI